MLWCHEAKMSQGDAVTTSFGPKAYRANAVSGIVICSKDSYRANRAAGTNIFSEDFCRANAADGTAICSKGSYWVNHVDGIVSSIIFTERTR
ncbi:hypothetical protein D8674_033735 [Pyrus ussuriensis x Pyrus communis]|uniref:Uncharacterized protein n=1 Tax=Pyrus ussuriensis x Pyrus communis TaxID=2448454 RepID=A0A5N5HTS4_9ROSA|nr:hypothetical protein D8674_033735 [Pyrus ussuriensis x Pyrus communis]